MIASAPIHWYDTLDSTSEEAKRLARQGDLGPVWLAAHRQTAGRGRLGRHWVSPPGNLFTTCLFHEAGGLTAATRLPFAAALAVRDSCVAHAPGASVALKWPNDVRVDGAKLAGILVESGETSGNLWIALGIGINIATAPETPQQATASLHGLGASPALTPVHILEDLKTRLERRIEEAREDFTGLLRHWQTHAEGLGEQVTAGPVDARLTGIFEGLSEDGGLQLRLPDGKVETIRAGDVELVRRVV
ncbi:MAG: biotin--[acetyl-CoA-carboxylase] ligase [Pseudomonadota bacterium]